MDLEMYLDNIRDKNYKNKIKYDKLVSKVPYFTSSKDLERLKDILDELKKENSDIYNYFISLLKTNSDLNILFLIYDEYKESKRREEILDSEVKSKNIEFSNIKEDLNYKEDDLKDFEISTKDLKTTGKILDDLSATTSINLNRCFNDMDEREINKLNFSTKALLALGGFLAFKNNKNILGVLLGSYLSYKVIEELSLLTNNKYINLCNKYIEALENYKDYALDIEKNLISNLDNIEKIEDELKVKYKDYLKEMEFKRLFKMIDDIKCTVNRSLKDIDKTKDNIDRNIDEGKVKIKVLEG